MGLRVIRVKLIQLAVQSPCLITNKRQCKESLLSLATVDLFQTARYQYINLSERFNLQTLHIRCRYVVAFSLINAERKDKFCPSAPETQHSCSCLEHAQFFYIQLFLRPLSSS
jgi:hypothetical protein